MHWHLYQCHTVQDITKKDMPGASAGFSGGDGKLCPKNFTLCSTIGQCCQFFCLNEIREVIPQNEYRVYKGFCEVDDPPAGYASVNNILGVSLV